LTGADLTSADLSCADLTGADLTWTQMPGTVGDAHTLLPAGFEVRDGLVVRIAPSPAAAAWRQLKDAAGSRYRDVLTDARDHAVANGWIVSSDGGWQAGPDVDELEP